MLILAIESATAVASIALADEKGLLGEVSINIGLTHSQQLLPLIDDLLRQCGKVKENLSHIGVSAGPGSFTGLRIGMATAKGLAQGLNLEVLAIPTLEALAYQLIGQPVLVSPMQNARREQIYGGLYRWREDPHNDSSQDGANLGDVRIRGKKDPADGGLGADNWILDCLIPPMAVSPQAWGARLKEIGQRVLLLGDGAQAYHQIWQEELGAQGRIVPPFLGLARGGFVALAAQKKILAGEKQDFYSMKPIYLRGI